MALGSSEERPGRESAGLAPHLRISLKSRLFPVGIEEESVPVVLWFRCLVTQSGPLRDLACGRKGEKRGERFLLSAGEDLEAWYFLDPHNCWSQRAHEESLHFKLHFSLRW